MAQGETEMAFTDADIAQAHQAATHQGALPDDLYRLGLIYSTGQGAPIDLVEAHKWFNLAATRGSDAAKACRRELADQMTTAEVAAAQRAAREWLNVIH
jgi:TPR repeat protein